MGRFHDLLHFYVTRELCMSEKCPRQNIRYNTDLLSAYESIKVQHDVVSNSRRAWTTIPTTTIQSRYRLRGLLCTSLKGKLSHKANCGTLELSCMVWTVARKSGDVSISRLVRGLGQKRNRSSFSTYQVLNRTSNTCWITLSPDASTLHVKVLFRMRRHKRSYCAFNTKRHI